MNNIAASVCARLLNVAKASFVPRPKMQFNRLIRPRVTPWVIGVCLSAFADFGRAQESEATQHRADR